MDGASSLSGGASRFVAGRGVNWERGGSLDRECAGSGGARRARGALRTVRRGLRRGARSCRWRAAYGAGAVRGLRHGVRGARRDVAGVRGRARAVVNLLRACSPDGECAAGGVAGLADTGNGAAGSGAGRASYGAAGDGARGAFAQVARYVRGGCDVGPAARRAGRAAYGADAASLGVEAERDVRCTEPRAPTQRRTKPSSAAPHSPPRPHPPRTPRTTCTNVPQAASHPAPLLAAPSPRHPHG